VNDHTNARIDGIGDKDRRFHDRLDVPQPATALDATEKSIHRWNAQFASINQLLQTAAHHMNVFNAHKVKFDIFIINFILVAFPLGLIDHGVYLQKIKWHLD